MKVRRIASRLQSTISKEEAASPEVERIGPLSQLSGGRFREMTKAQWAALPGLKAVHCSRDRRQAIRPAQWTIIPPVNVYITNRMTRKSKK